MSSAWTPEVLKQLREQAHEELAAKPLRRPPPTAETKDPAPFPASFKTAAVISELTAKEIAALASDPREEESLRASCVGDETSLTLQPEVRNDVLQQITADELRSLLDRNPRSGDALQNAFRRTLEGGFGNLLRLDPAELAALKQFHRGLSSIASVPPRDLIDRKLELARVLDPLRAITQNFVGRQRELEQLRDYVGVLPPSSALGAVRRLISSAFQPERRDPFLIFGIGGIGKTTLLARFILDHVFVEAAQLFPFAYLDFDRPSVSAEEPLTLLDETLRQIGLQYDEAYEPSVAIRARWEPKLRAARHGERSEDDFIADFAGFLTTLGVSEGPVLLALDTFEEVQMRSAAFSRAVIRLMTRLTERIPRLRVVLAGRGDLRDVSFSARMALMEFDELSALAYLGARGIDREAALSIFQRLGGNPLSLNLAANAFGNSPDFATLYTGNLFSRIQGEVIQAQLFDRILLHIPDVDARKLVYPGMVVRRITPEVILEILAEPCEVDVPDLARAQELFDDLGRLVSVLVTNEFEPGVLFFHPKLRALMAKPLRESRTAAVESIHRRAVAYYEQREDAVSRAEEIYHRLSLGQSRREVEPRLLPGIEPYLYGAIEELDLPQQALLAQMFELESPAAARLEADQETWELDAAKRIRECVGARRGEAHSRVHRHRRSRDGGADSRGAQRADGAHRSSRERSDRAAAVGTPSGGTPTRDGKHRRVSTGGQSQRRSLLTSFDGYDATRGRRSSCGESYDRCGDRGRTA